MAARNYSSVARLASLTAGVSNSATTFPVDQTTGFPTVPFTLVADPGRTAEEAVTVTAVVGLNLTVVRGVDGTAAQPHDAAASLRHMATARDYREAAEHIDSTTGVHGATGLLVDTLSTQSIDNKTFTAAVTDHVPLTIAAASGQTANLANFTTSGGTVIASVGVTGRVTTPGVDGTSSSTLTAGSSAIVPLIVKGAASQSANIISVRDSTSTEVAGISAAGGISIAGALGALGNVVSFATVQGAAVSASATVAGSAALTVQNAGTATTPVVAVKNAAGTTTAGFGTEAQGFQLFHGSSTNFVPFRMHGGTGSAIIAAGTTSQSGTIDISSFGFTDNPIVSLTIRQDNESTIKRRVAINQEGPTTTTAINFRIFQTAAEAIPSDTLYVVYWMAHQFTPTTAAG